MTFTKEQLIEKLKHRISVASGFPDSEKAQMDLELARIALASLEAEAVAWTWEIYGGGNMYAKIKPTSLDAIPLYTAPPAPVSVPDDLEMKPILKDGHQIVGYEYRGERYGTTAGCAWNSAIRTCRAAMLQGAEPVKTAYKLRDAVETIRNSGIEIDAEKIFAERDALNSPVIPDGWVMVPVDATRAMIDAARRVEEDGYDAMHKAMLAAAPQQEVKP